MNYDTQTLEMKLKCTALPAETQTQGLLTAPCVPHPGKGKSQTYCRGQSSHSQGLEERSRATDARQEERCRGRSRALS